MTAADLIFLLAAGLLLAGFCLAVDWIADRVSCLNRARQAEREAAFLAAHLPEDVQ